MRRVIVIGAGIAGTAAAWSAAKAGASVVIVAEGAGASELGGGAIDDAPWEHIARSASDLGVTAMAQPVDERVEAFVEALGAWKLGEAGSPMPQIATRAGIVRPCRGHDRGLLDLGRLRGGTIVVPDVGRPGWDARLVALSLGAHPTSAAMGLHFKPIEVDLLRFTEERWFPDVDFAARHEDEDRQRWLADRMRDAIARAEIQPLAILCGPWLGSKAAVAEALGAKMKIPVGEALMGVGGPAGSRFAGARDRLFLKLGARVVSARVVGVRRDEDRVEVAMRPRGDALAEMETRESPSFEEEIEAWGAGPQSGGRAVNVESGDRVVLACGGLAGGGIVYEPSDVRAGGDLPAMTSPPFRLSFGIEAGVSIRAFGTKIGVGSSIHGLELDRRAWPTERSAGVLEDVGIEVDARGEASTWIYGAGSVVAGEPRTALAAIRSGIRAGEQAATGA